MPVDVLPVQHLISPSTCDKVSYDVNAVRLNVSFKQDNFLERNVLSEHTLTNTGNYQFDCRFCFLCSFTVLGLEPGNLRLRLGCRFNFTLNGYE